MLTDEYYHKSLDFKPSNMVMVVRFQNSLNLMSVFELLTIVPFMYEINSKSNNRDKIPYFGVERAIVGIRYKKINRGIRKGDNSMSNIIALDFQYCKKNIHIKLSKNNLVIVGILNKNMGLEVAKIVLMHIKMVYELFLLKNKINASKLVDKLLKVIKNGENVYMYDDEIVSNFINSLKPNDYNFIKYLTMFTADYTSYEKFSSKVKDLMNKEFVCYKKFPEITYYEIVNGIYHYNIGLPLSLINLTKFLDSKGLSVLYNNWDEPNFMYLMIPLAIVEDENETSLENLKKRDFKTPKIKSHRFRINKSGTIRQTSPTDVDDAIKIKNFLLYELSEFLQDFI